MPGYRRIQSMYIPAAFAETDLTTLHDFIEEHSFGLLVSQVDGLSFGSHVPFLLERQAGPKGTLAGHVARGNPQWHDANGQAVLAVFTGPHAYISPSWYEAEQVVPTWNYVAVHVYGRIQVIEERESLLRIVRELVKVYEENMPRPWKFDESTTFSERMLAQIVGFNIEIERIEGKWKLNQNHPAERRRKVIEKLSEHGGEDARAMAEMMTRQLDSTPTPPE